MVDLEEALCGRQNILFSSEKEFKQVTITGFVLNSAGQVLYLTGLGGTIYNWQNIVAMRKMK